MKEYFNEIILTIVGLGTTTLLILLGRGIKWLSSIKKNVDMMVNHGEARKKENIVQFKMLNSQTKASRTILEVVAKNQNNGNVERAFEHLDESDKIYASFTNELLEK